MRKYLKRPKVGLEVELFTLDNTGNPVPAVDRLIKNCPVQKRQYAIQREYAKHLLEIGAFPTIQVRNLALSFLENLEAVAETAEEMDLLLYPLGTYPGKFTSEVRRDYPYVAKEKVLGEPFKNIAPKVAGFHFHYGLPRGVLNRSTYELRMTKNSQAREAFLSAYNFLIAADPALTTFMQSSPFFEGKLLGKDSRTLLYRDMKSKVNDEIIRGIYREERTFGRIPRYANTAADLNFLVEKRRSSWEALMKDAGMSYEKISHRKKPLDLYWGPVRINKLGTLEQRGMDMNEPKYVVGISILLRHILRQINRMDLKVKASDVGAYHPFKLEGDTIHIAPFSKVKNDLQYKSALDGLEDKEILNYCRSFYRLSKKFIEHDRGLVLKSIKNMLKTKRTKSDMVIRAAKRKGYSGDSELPQEVSAEIAIKYSKKFITEIEKTKSDIKNISLDD